MCTTNVTTVTAKGPPQLNFSSSCRVAKRERKLYSRRQYKTRSQDSENSTQEDKTRSQDKITRQDKTISQDNITRQDHKTRSQVKARQDHKTRSQDKITRQDHKTRQSSHPKTRQDHKTRQDKTNDARARTWLIETVEQNCKDLLPRV